MYRPTLFAILGLVMTSATDDSAPRIDRVEEDWELVIRTTDVPAAGPQITTTMCPGPVDDHPHANFNLNYRDGEAFQPGGLQVVVFDDRIAVATASARAESLQSDNETITWTQRLSISAGTVAYRVQAGHSTTWGEFGGDELAVTFPSTLSDLGAYSPDVSSKKSGIGWQSDHVSSMRLMQVRYYSGDTLVATDGSPKVVHPVAAP